MKIVKVVTVLDIELWEARECFGQVFFNQLHKADLILLNKIDVVDEQQTLQFLKEIHDTMPHAQVIPTIHCMVEPEIVMADCAMAPKIADFAEFNHPYNDRGSIDGSLDYISFTFRCGDVLDEAGFKTFTENLPWELFRMKGPVRFRDRTIMVNYVGGKSEWTMWHDETETCLVFIGWKVEAKGILKNLQESVVDSN
jgi:G3E family GTPase